jgi:hypothetical protein
MRTPRELLRLVYRIPIGDSLRLTYHEFTALKDWPQSSQYIEFTSKHVWTFGGRQLVLCDYPDAVDSMWMGRRLGDMTKDELIDAFYRLGKSVALNRYVRGSGIEFRLPPE